MSTWKLPSPEENPENQFSSSIWLGFTSVIIESGLIAGNSLINLGDRPPFGP